MRNRLKPRLAALLAALLASMVLVGLPTSPAQAAETPDWLPIKGASTSEVGCTWSNGCAGSYHGYYAIDFIMPVGVPIYAAGPGTVVAANGSCTTTPVVTCDSRGRYVEISHPDGRHSRYLHLNDVVKASGSVSRGELIGHSGNTMANGIPHLHYDETINGVKVDPGPMKAVHGSQLVEYPSALNAGYNSWDDVPSWSNYMVHNDTYTVPGGGSPPPADVTPDLNHDGKPDLYHIAYTATGSGKVEVHVVNGANAFSSYLSNLATVWDLPNVAEYDTRYMLADHNGDTYPDLYRVDIDKAGADIGRVHMHILSGSSGFTVSLGDLADVDSNTNPAGTWYGIADSDANGSQDLHKVVFNGTSSGKTEVHIRNGSDSYQSWLRNWVTVANTSALGTVSFDLAHNNGDGAPDLYQVIHGGVPKPQVHVLSGASAFTVSLADFETSYVPPNPLTGWWFGVADHNADHTPDLFAMVNDPGSGKMALHIMKGAGGFQDYYGQWLIVENVQTPGNMTYLI